MIFHKLNSSSDNPKAVQDFLETLSLLQVDPVDVDPTKIEDYDSKVVKNALHHSQIKTFIKKRIESSKEQIATTNEGKNSSFWISKTNIKIIDF